MPFINVRCGGQHRVLKMFWRHWFSWFSWRSGDVLAFSQCPHFKGVVVVVARWRYVLLPLWGLENVAIRWQKYGGKLKAFEMLLGLLSPWRILASSRHSHFEGDICYLVVVVTAHQRNVSLTSWGPKNVVKWLKVVADSLKFVRYSRDTWLSFLSILGKSYHPFNVPTLRETSPMW